MRSGKAGSVIITATLDTQLLPVTVDQRTVNVGGTARSANLLAYHRIVVVGHHHMTVCVCRSVDLTS